jgi:hypothetical protein
VGRLSERLARLQAEAAERNKVILIITRGCRGEPDILTGVMGGSAGAQAKALAAWYAENPRALMKPEHQALLKAAGLRLLHQAVTIVGAATPQERERGAEAVRARRQPRSNSRLGTREAGVGPKLTRRLPRGGDLFGASHGVPELRSARR